MYIHTTLKYTASNIKTLNLPILFNMSFPVFFNIVLRQGDVIQPEHNANEKPDNHQVIRNLTVAVIVVTAPFGNYTYPSYSKTQHIEIN